MLPFHKSTVILIELRWAFSIPENRLKSRLLPFLSINEPRCRQFCGGDLCILWGLRLSVLQ